MFRRLKLLKYCQQINLSPEDTLALIRRLETDSCRVEDYEVLIRTVRAHMELSADFLAAPRRAAPEVERSAPGRQAKRKRQGTKRARRRR